MKTKIKGHLNLSLAVAWLIRVAHKAPTTVGAGRACCQNKKEEVFSYWYTNNLASWFYKGPLDDYRQGRENGAAIDSPKRPFPHNGYYGWDHPENDSVYVEYTEGDLDNIWMEEKDKNYVMRLENEGRLAAVEPNLKVEVPKLYVEVLAKRTKNIALVGEYLRAIEKAEREYLAAQKHWLTADKAFRQICATYWQTYYDAKYESGQKQADAKRTLDQHKTEMQKAKAITQEPEALLQVALMAKQKSEQTAVAKIEALVRRPSPELLRVKLAVQKYAAEEVKSKLAQKIKVCAATKEQERIQAEKLAKEQATHEAALRIERVSNEKKAQEMKECIESESTVKKQAPQLALDVVRPEVEQVAAKAEPEKLPQSEKEFVAKQLITNAQGQNSTTTLCASITEPGALSTLVLEPGAPAISPPRAPVIQSHAAILEKTKIGFAELVYGQVVLGKGGCGIVYAGTWNGVPAAIKELNLPLNEEGELKVEFLKEAGIMANLRHPHVILLYGVCLERGHYSMVMELMPKGSLYSLLHNNQDIPWHIRWQIAVDIGHALAYLHRQNPMIIHRDLKSPNILLDDRLRAKITDFGISKIKEVSGTLGSKVMGTTRWMPPELFTEDEVIHYTDRNDIYSLGVIYWEIASRKVPYAALTDMQVTVKLMRGQTEKIPADCPQAFANIITQCWQREPVDRPPAAEIVTQLAALGRFSFFGGNENLAFSVPVPAPALAIEDEETKANSTP